MAGGSAKLVIAIITDASKASKGMDDAAGQFGKFGDTMSNLQGPALATLGGITAMAAGTVTAASDMQQAMGGVEAVFGENADQVKKWASEAAQSVGLSASEYAGFASTVGAQLKNLGVPLDDVAGQTDEMIRLGADLAATYGGTTADAVSALGSALRGEADPAERYGLALSQTAVNAELAATGMADLEGPALQAAKAQAIMGLATEQAGGAMGQAAREADTVAGQQQRLEAQTKDAAAAIGTAFLPVVAAVTGALADMAGFIKENTRWILPLIGVVAALAGAILIANAAMSAWNTIQTVAKGITVAYTAVQKALNASFLANPITLVIMAVIALVAAFIWLWNNVEGFRNFFIGIWDGIKAAIAAVTNWFVATWKKITDWFKNVWNVAVAIVSAYFIAWRILINAVIQFIRGIFKSVADFFKSVWRGAVDSVINIVNTLKGVFDAVFNAILTPINWVVDAFKTVVGWIQTLIDWLGRIRIPDVFGAIGDVIGQIGGRSATVAVSAAGTARLAAGVGTRAVTGGGPTYNITVNGGIDTADAIARKVEAVLRGRQRRTGGVVIGRAVT